MTESEPERIQQRALPRIGDVLEGEYRIDSVIASGGMGVIAKGTDLKMERDVAIKLLHPHLASEDATVRRFEREIHLAKVLNHPNVIQLFDYGHTDEDALFIVMEYLDGEDLEALIEREGPLEVGRACDITLQLLDGLTEAHGRDVVHRDLKPSNVFVTERHRGGDHAKVLDFGIAKSLETSTTVTATGQVPGTAPYLPPESVFETSPGKPGDVYAAGLILLEMILGRRVFDAETLPLTLAKHLKEPIPMPAALADTPLGEVLASATAKHPDERYPDASAMLSALAEAVDDTETDFTVDPERITSTEPERLPNDTSDPFSFDFFEQPAGRQASADKESPVGGPTTGPGATSPMADSPEQPPSPPPTEDTGPRAPTEDTGPRAPTERMEPVSTAVTPPTAQPTTSELAPGDAYSRADSEQSSAPTEASDAIDEEVASFSDNGSSRGLVASVAAGLVAVGALGVGWWWSAGTSSEAGDGPGGQRQTAVSAGATSPDSGPPEQAARGDTGTSPEIIRILVASEPTGARVRKDGRLEGRTPLPVTLERDRDGVELTVRKSGFTTETLTVDPSAEKTRYLVELQAEQTADRGEEREERTGSASPEPEDNSRAREPDPPARDRPRPASPSRESTAPKTGDPPERDPFEEIADDLTID